MNLYATIAGNVSEIKETGAKVSKLQPLQVVNSIGLYQKSLGKSGETSFFHLRSTLLAGVGFVNLFEVRVDGVGSLSDLRLKEFKRFKPFMIDGVKADRLKEFVGNLDSQALYLLEFPEGYLLSFNDEILGFTAQ